MVALIFISEFEFVAHLVINVSCNRHTARFSQSFNTCGYVDTVSVNAPVFLHHIPEVTEVVDVTDHASGTDPFYA